MLHLLLALTTFSSPQSIELQQLEPLIKKRLSALTYKSPRFDSELKKILKTANAELRWEPAFGPTSVSIAWVRLKSASEQGTIAFWPTTESTGVQVLDSWLSTESKPGLQRESQDFVYGEAYRRGNRMVRCGYSNDGVNYVGPITTVYSLKNDRWKVDASLSVSNVFDALPGTRFARKDRQVDPNHIVAMLGVYPTFLQQPHGAPHLVYRQIWTIRGKSISRGPRRLIPTATSELDLLSNLAKHGRRREFDSHVPTRYRVQLWESLQNSVSASCSEGVQHDYCTHLTCDQSLSLIFVRMHGGYRLIKMSMINE